MNTILALCIGLFLGWLFPSPVGRVVEYLRDVLGQRVTGSGPPKPNPTEPPVVKGYQPKAGPSAPADPPKKP